MKRTVPYHRAEISQADIDSVVQVLQSGWLTAGPRTTAFERAFAAFKGAKHAVAVNSCTAALRLCLHTLDLKPGDEVITTPMTFVATANSILHAGGKPVFADIDPLTLNLDPAHAESKINARTRAFLPVHMGGNACDMHAFTQLATQHGLEIIEDCAHAIEATFAGRQLGTFGMASAFSFYPTKNITTTEGGMVLTDDDALAERIRRLSRHGLNKGTYQRMEVEGNPLYDMLEPGFKMNMTDLQAALGLSQLERINAMHHRRMEIKAMYDRAFAGSKFFKLTGSHPDTGHASHLYQLLLEPGTLTISRDAFVQAVRASGVELSVNYLPVHLFTWYRESYGYRKGDFPVAELVGETNISLPIYPLMTDEDVQYVIEVLQAVAVGNAR